MRRSRYKISEKSAALQFPIGGRDRHIVQRIRCRTIKRKSSRSTGKKSKRMTKKKKKICAAGRKMKKPSETSSQETRHICIRHILLIEIGIYGWRKSKSFLHIHLSEYIKSDLALFSLLPTQTSIESSQRIYYKSVTSLADDSPIEFVIPGHGEDYLDLIHTVLSLCIRVESEHRESTSMSRQE